MLVLKKTGMNYNMKNYILFITLILIGSLNAIDRATILHYKEQNPAKASEISFHARLIEQREKRLEEELSKSNPDEELVQGLIDDIRNLNKELEEIAYPELRQNEWEWL